MLLARTENCLQTADDTHLWRILFRLILGFKMFKDSFKYYKARKPPPDLKHVIDIKKTDDPAVSY